MTAPTPWLQEPVLSRRLVLRPGRDTAADREAAVELLTDPRVRQFIGGPLSAEDAREAVSGRPAGQRWGSFVLQMRHGDDGEEGAVIGVCSLSRERDELEIGYLLLPRYWGKGLASEAVTTVLAWVAEHLDDKHVIAVTQAANTASLRLLARLGFAERERFVEYDADQVLLTAPVDRLVLVAECRLHQGGNLSRDQFWVVKLVVQLAIEPEGGQTVGQAPGGYAEDVGLVRPDDPRVYALGHGRLQLVLGGVLGRLQARVLTGARQLGAKHEPEVAGFPPGEGDVGAEQPGKGADRRSGPGPAVRQLHGEQFVAASRQRGEQVSPVGEVIVRRARADPAFPRYPAQADRADALGLY